MSETVIALNGLSRRFPGMDRPAVAPLTCTIRAGYVTGLVGPDGAGKTTLMRMLAGLLKPDEGRASVIGFDPLKDDSALHAVLGYMPQKFGLYEDLTVMENLTLYADLRSVTGEARKKIFDRLLEFTSLGPFTERLAGKLSGGMKQKLGLACTLVGDPKVLLLDEPGVGVDPISRRELWQMVHELAGDGMLILWSTSYLDEAEQCRDVLLMNEGKLLYQGEPTALTQTMVGRSFLVSSPQENNRRLLQRALKLPQVSDGVIQGKSVRLILKKDARIEEVQQHGDMPPLQVADTAPRFEDAFIDLLGGAGTAESPLGAIIHRVDGSKEETVIEAQSLTKKFGDFAATDHVDFQVKRGEIFGLLGPNGAGKSTTFKMMCGLLVPTSGKALVLGMDLKVSSGKARQHLGYMAQKFSLGPFTERLAGKLSGGMKQKLGLACTLVGDPKVLLLDEPGVGVDPISRRELWQMVHELAGDGMLILWSTSYLDEAEQCRDVLLMNEGKLLYQGEPTALTQTMAGRSFLVSSQQENNRRLLQRALKLPQVSDGVIQGKSVRLILKKDARIEEVQQHGDMPPLQVADTAPRFEDAFIDLLGGAGTAESPLGAIIHRVDGSKEETVIEAQSLTKKFGDFAATDHVDFQVKRGEIFGLLGPNGAGKSTTFKMMCGLLVPTSGKALVLGMDLKVSSGKARQHLGYMAQKFSLYGNLSVEQNLRFFSGVYGLRGRAQNEKIARMSDAFGLKSIARHAADELPLGYKQRLALACSLMHEPDILFLDEPTSGVDPLTRREFWLHINSMVDKGVTVMVTTHFMDEAEYCDRIGLVYHGKLIASGTPDALKAQAADDSQTDPTMEQAFITLINRWDKENSHGQ
ncbi:ABC transporter multidrug efflux pump [Klebsiella pneumoniae]|nr:ABC transporter multidrug efflux pump [Klebsiella pneumoniae]